MKILESLKKNWIEVAIVLALFLIAFAIRVQTYDNFVNPDTLKWGPIYGFDSFYEARSAKYLITQGYVWPSNDSVTDYPFNRGGIYPGDLGWIGLTGIIYQVTALINNIHGFDFATFGWIDAWMVVIDGSIGIAAVYLFGRYAFNRWIGLSAALLLAGSNGHLFYSIFGHAENDATGFTLFFLLLFAFVMTVKKRSWKFGVATTLLGEALSTVWQAYNVAVILIGGTIATYFIIYALLRSFGYYKESDDRKATRRWMLYGTLFVIPSIFRWDMLLIRGALGGATELAILPLAGAVIIGALAEIYLEKIKVSRETFRTNPFVKSLGLGVAALLISMLAIQFLNGASPLTIVTSPLSYIGINLVGGLSTPDYNQRLLTTIAEQNPISGSNFFERLGTLSNSGFGLTVWLAFLSVILIAAKIIIMPFIRKDFTYEWDIMALAFIFYSMWKLTSQAITMFFLAGAIAFGAGYFLGSLVTVARWIEHRVAKVKPYARLAAASLIFVVGFSFITTIIPAGAAVGFDIPHEWFETFDWLNTVAPANSVITMWWDYGHWVNYFSGDNKSHPIYTNLDNIQDRPDMIFTVASAFTHTPPCKQDSTTKDITCDSSQEGLNQAALESLSILRPLVSTHILVDKEVALGKFNALMTIANQYQGCFQDFGCNRNADGVVCPVGTATQNGQNYRVGFQFDNTTWNSLKKKWPGTAGALPVSVLGTNNTAASVNSRWFAKESSGGGLDLYGSALQCGGNFFQGGANPNAPIVYTLAHRIFFDDPSLPNLKEVFDNGWNTIYAVNFTGVPNPKQYTDWTKTHAVVCDEPYKSIYCKNTNPYASY